MKKSNNFSKIVIGIGVLIVGLLAAMLLLNRSGDIRLIYTSNAEFQAILDDDSGEGHFVYVGRLECPACTRLREIVETLPGFDADLAYFETAMAGETDPEWTNALLSSVGIEGVPVILYIENGIVVDRLIGVQNASTLTDFFDRNGGLE